MLTVNGFAIPRSFVSIFINKQFDRIIPVSTMGTWNFIRNFVSGEYIIEAVEFFRQSLVKTNLLSDNLFSNKISIIVTDNCNEN